MTASHPQDGVEDERSRKSDAGQDEAPVLLHPPDEPLLQRRVLHRFEFSGELFFGESRKRMSQPRSARWHDSNWIRDIWTKSQTFLSLLRLQLLARVEKMLNVNNSCSNDPSQTKLIFSQPKNGRVSKILRSYLVLELYSWKESIFIELWAFEA